MSANDNSGESTVATADTDVTSDETNLDQLQNAFQQWQSAISDFLRETETSQDATSTAIQQLSERSMVSADRFRDEIQRLEEWIRNNRR